MSLDLTILALLGFILLTAGTALFVAAEFSLTALERSTVDANARAGGRRDQLVQRAPHTVVPVVRRPDRHLDHHADHRLPGRTRARAAAQPAFARCRLTQRIADGLALALALLIATSVSMVFGELVPKNLAVAHRCRRRASRPRRSGVLDDVHPGDQAAQRHRELDPAPAGHRAGRGTALGALPAGTRLAGA